MLVVVAGAKELLEPLELVELVAVAMVETPELTELQILVVVAAAPRTKGLLLLGMAAPA